MPSEPVLPAESAGALPGRSPGQVRTVAAHADLQVADAALGDHTMEQEAWARLSQVYDPELGIDLVNLGLIYELGAQAGELTVAMTLTTPGCPMGVSIPEQVQFTLDTIPGVRLARVELVWDPPWEPEMMSDAAKHSLGWG
ncbi:MAG: metal-sulfur cluster assembly factor [Candidatus Dormibacteria bacterium]